MPKKKTPVSFDSWLGKVIDDEADTHGGRGAIAQWIGVSEQSVNRRARGDVPYLAREVEIISRKVKVPTAELVARALRGYGGMEKLLAEHGPKMSEDPANFEDHKRRKQAQAAGMTGDQIDAYHERGKGAATGEPELGADERDPT